MDDIKQEFWGDLQVDLYTANTAIYLANQTLEQIISTDGKKAHRPILSHSQVGTYTAHNDINFKEKRAEKQTLEVATFDYAADDIDITESYQTPYDLLSHSLTSIRRGLMNAFEQKYLSEITNAFHAISASAFTLDTTNALDVFRTADARLGAFDVPRATAMKSFVGGPNSIALLRQIKSQRESGLGDETMENGVVGPWHGWTVVENNNLPWSATLTLATKPTANDTVTISGVTFKFVATLGTDAGNVLIGDDDASARANLKAAIEGGTGAGTTYVDISPMNDFILRRKRNVKATNDDTANTLAFTGYGDIGVSETLTAAADVWSAQQQMCGFMIRGAIDAVMQFLDLEVDSKEKGFAKLPKGIIGMGTKVFSDGAIAMVKLPLDASNFV
jgi:hypothetical protein